MDAPMRPHAGNGADVLAHAGSVLSCRDDGQSPPGAPVFLCVHGWAAEASFFAPQAEDLAARFRVVRVDLPGHGRSRTFGSRAHGHCTIDRMAEDLAQCLEALDLSRVIAVGWSMGAMVLWRMLARAPSAVRARVIGLVSVDMAPRVFNAPDWALGLGPDAAASEKMIDAMTSDWAAFSAGFTPRVFAPGADAALLAQWGAKFADADARTMAAYWRSMAETDCRADVASITLPMLACYGAQSQLYPSATTHWIAEHAPHAVAVRFSRSGHAPHLEEPQRFNAVLNAFAGAQLIADDPGRILARFAQSAPAGTQSGEDLFLQSNAE